MPAVRVFIAFTGGSLIVAGILYLFFPHVGVGLTGMELPAASAAIDARATYGGTQLGLGIFLLWCRRRQDTVRIGLVLILVVGACLALARVYGWIVDGGPGWFNALGITVEGGLAAVAATLLRRGERDA